MIAINGTFKKASKRTLSTHAANENFNHVSYRPANRSFAKRISKLPLFF